MPDLGDFASNLGEDALNEVKESLGDAWDEVTEAERDSIKRVAKRYFELKLEEKLGKDVSRQLQVVKASTVNWRVVGAISLEKAFWRGVQKVATVLAGFLVAGLAAL